MIALPPLPYSEDALEPVISRESVRSHRMLQVRYVRNVAEAMLGPLPQEWDMAALSRELIRVRSRGDRYLIEQAAQAFNHEFWWHCLRPPGGSAIAGKLRGLVLNRYGSFDVFVSAAVSESQRVFGSGWLWLTPELAWVGAPDASQPVRWPLLTIDLWEHAYWLDYRPAHPWGPSGRDRFVHDVLHKIANWDVARLRLTLTE